MPRTASKRQPGNDLSSCGRQPSAPVAVLRLSSLDKTYHMSSSVKKKEFTNSQPLAHEAGLTNLPFNLLNAVGPRRRRWRICTEHGVTTGNPGFRSGHMFQPAPGRASQTRAPPTCWSHAAMPSTTFAVKAADHMNWHTVLEPRQWWDLWYNGWWVEVSCCSTKKLACSFVVPGNWCVKNSICLEEQLGCRFERQPGGLIHPHVFQESVRRHEEGPNMFYSGLGPDRAVLWPRSFIYTRRSSSLNLPVSELNPPVRWHELVL